MNLGIKNARRLTGKRDVPNEHLIGQHTKRVHVSGAIWTLALRSF